MAGSSADPWAGGNDPWADASLPKGPPPPPGRGREAPDSSHVPVTGLFGGKGGPRGHGGKTREQPLGAGQGMNKGGGKGRGNRGGQPMQKQKMRDWHIPEPPRHPEPPPPQGDSGAASAGRGRAMIAPAWKSTIGPEAAPSIPEAPPAPPSPRQQAHQAAPEVPPMLAKGRGRGDAASPSPAAPEQRRRPREREAPERTPELREAPGEQERRRAVSCRGGNDPFSQARASIEVEVQTSFAAPGPGDWLPCSAGDVLLVVYSEDNLAFARSHCKRGQPDGWVPIANLRPLRHPGYHEFLVPLKRHHVLGFTAFPSTGDVPGFVIFDVTRGALDDWNRLAATCFPRNQVIPGDIITSVNGCNEEEAMRKMLCMAPGSGALRLVVVRARGLCALASQGPEATLRELFAAHRHTLPDSQSQSSTAARGRAAPAPAAPAQAAPAQAPEEPPAPSRGADPWAARGADPWAASADPWAAAAPPRPPAQERRASNHGKLPPEEPAFHSSAHEQPGSARPQGDLDPWHPPELDHLAEEWAPPHGDEPAYDRFQ